MKQTSLPLLTIATYFTLARLACIPFIVGSIISHAWFIAGAFFIVASLTDVLDGMLARSLNEVSWFGTILDPLVDKIMLTTIYASLAVTHSLVFTIPQWFVVLIVIHELLLILGTAYWVLWTHKLSIDSSRLAKLVGIGQFLFIAWVFVCSLFGCAPQSLFQLVLLLIALARSCVLVQYARRLYEVVV